MAIEERSSNKRKPYCVSRPVAYRTASSVKLHNELRIPSSSIRNCIFRGWGCLECGDRRTELKETNCVSHRVAYRTMSRVKPHIKLRRCVSRRRLPSSRTTNCVSHQVAYQTASSEVGVGVAWSVAIEERSSNKRTAYPVELRTELRLASSRISNCVSRQVAHQTGSSFK